MWNIAPPKTSSSWSSKNQEGGGGKDVWSTSFDMFDQMLKWWNPVVSNPQTRKFSKVWSEPDLNEDERQWDLLDLATTNNVDANNVSGDVNLD